MNNSQNPYAPPQASTELERSAEASIAPPETLGAVARRTFLIWERLRLIYLAILTGVTLLMLVVGGQAVIQSVRVWQRIIEGCIVANVCYLAGPLLESYAAWLGFSTRSLRITLFVLGTLVSMALALVVLAAEIFSVLI